jgi:hypothetical protein
VTTDPHPRPEQVRALLEAEAAEQMHPTPGRLDEPSGALGLLWIRRCLCFQHAILHGARLEDEHEHGSVKAVSDAAYAAFYAPYHGWLVRKTFQLGLAAVVPSRDNPNHDPNPDPDHCP